jgi:hypothetical protein
VDQEEAEQVELLFILEQDQEEQEILLPYLLLKEIMVEQE